MLDQSQRKVKSISLNVFRCYCKQGHRRQFCIAFTVIDHKNDTIKWSKQSEQSMGGVEENPLWGFTMLFCCGIFRFDRLKRHQYMLENLMLDLKVGHWDC